MSEPCTGHGIYLSGIFEIGEKLTQEQLLKVEFRSYALAIHCIGANRIQDLAYDIRGTGFSSPAFKLEPGTICLLRGAVFPTNTKDTHNNEFFYEGSDRFVIGTADTFSANLDNTIGITGIGRVLSFLFKVEESMQYLKTKANDSNKVTMHVIVQHCDFHPQTKLPRSMTVEYRIPPFKHLAGSPQIVKEGRECQFHGYIKDFNEDTHRYIVIVNKVSPTSGHQELTPNVRSAQSNKQSNSAGRMKSKFASRAPSTPFKTPLTASDSSPDIPFGPGNVTPSSIASTSGTLASSMIPDPPTSQPAKKRARAPPKRKATKDVVIPNSDEI
ncbi:uncharacterized protein MELLADRAFT_91131 [Melampsora larici-populina 98AG31]|uniref:Uncharacterized protein n=1 Tax=Melampsora larici-populina (strain 98AG31 / pathotype 3-4-7) TaxID=747676 RepID=F4R790_MELLP|nr:uncharacterized protein MELLADRAFT_91131 [Melampsora larici-populina 98AG31]EGG11548.1 hypothetical protein MELLADRAFT_91131 [Melampsora larici-populina 98AG31]